MMLSKPFLTRKVANSSIMDNCRRTAPSLFKMHGRKSLTLHSRSYFGYSSDVDATIVAQKGCQ